MTKESLPANRFCESIMCGDISVKGNRSRDGVWLISRPKHVALGENQTAENVPDPLILPFVFPSSASTVPYGLRGGLEYHTPRPFKANRGEQSATNRFVLDFHLQRQKARNERHPRACYDGRMSQDCDATDESRWYIAAAGVVVLIGAVLRLTHIDFELPRIVDVDSFKSVGEAARMITTGDYRPQDFQYPGLYVNLLVVVYKALGLETPYAWHLSARLVAAFFGIAQLPLTWLLARRIAGPAAALIATSLVAFSPLAVTMSRMAATDAMVTFWMTAGLCLVIPPSDKLVRYLGCGALLGLAVGTKYTGAYLGFFLVLSAVLAGYLGGKVRRPLVGIVVGLSIAAIVFLATTPWFVSLFEEYRQRVELEMEIQKYGQIGHVQAGYFDYLVSTTPTWEQPWLGTSLWAEFGPVSFALVLGATLFVLSGRFGISPFLLGLYVVGYLIAMSGPGRLKAMRFMLPILPVCAVLVGWAIEKLLATRFKRGQIYVVIAATVLVTVSPAIRSINYLRTFFRPSTNTVARQWIAEHIPANSAIFVPPFYNDDLAGLPLNFFFLPDAGGRQYRLPEDAGPSSERAPMFHAQLVDALRAQGVEYVLRNSHVEGAFSDVADNQRWFPCSVAAYAEYEARLEAVAEPLFRVPGFEAGRQGGDITVYRLRTDVPPSYE